MTYKTILVHVEPTPKSDARLQVAADLAFRWGSTLIGVGGCEPCYIANPMLFASDGEVIRILADQEHADLEAARKQFRKRTGQLGDSARWASSHDYPDAALTDFAAGADLILSTAHRGPRASTAAAADLVMRAGIPVLTSPDECEMIRTKDVIVAWKNTPEARRAISDALPLLRAAGTVTVLCMCPEGTAKNHSRLAEVVERLERDGVTATGIERTGPDDAEGADGIIAVARDRLADVIVAGAYGHSRMREWMLGGMTQGLLERSTIPVMFSH